jgi:hypothetical protein
MDSHTIKIESIKPHDSCWQVVMHGHVQEAKYVLNLLTEAGLPILRDPVQIQDTPLYSIDVNDHRPEVEEQIKKALCENQYISMPEDGAD